MLSEPGQEVRRVSVQFHPNGRLIAAGGGSVVNLFMFNGLMIRTLEQGSGVNAIAFHSKGRYLAVACLDHAIRVWDVDPEANLGRLVFTLRDHQHSVESVAFSANGTRLISGDEGGTVIIWRVEAEDE